MEFSSAYTITYGFTAVLFILLFRCYRIIKKTFSSFPIAHLLPHILYCILTGKLEKDAALKNGNSDEGKKRTKEGMFMVYITRPYLFIFNEEAVKFFLTEKAASNKSVDYENLLIGMGNGIHVSNGERWKKHRKIINPAFYLGILKKKVPLFNQHASALVKDLETLADKPSTELLHAIKVHYFNALIESLFGLKQSEEQAGENLKFLQLVEAGCHLVTERMLCQWLQWMPINKVASRVMKDYKTYVENVIYDMKKFVISNKKTDAERFDTEHLNKSFTYIMLNHHLNDTTFTFEDVYDEVSVMLAAGHDTVTYSTLWYLFLLGLYPEVQEKAFLEIKLKTGTYVTYEDSCNLIYLEAVIKETLRLYPTIPIFARSLSKNVQFGKYEVDKSTSIVFFPYLLHRNPELYPNPENFDPGRFLSSETKRPLFIPFSGGSRNCIGEKYAVIEMKIFLAHILRNFKITSYDRQEDVKPCWNIVITPENPIRMKITPRQEKCP